MNPQLGWDSLWVNAHLATMDETREDALGSILDGAVAVRDGRIVWVGRRAELPSDWHTTEEIDCSGAWITPGLIDCHTHLLYAGSRAEEFEMRLAGASYESIARAGGGIASTVRATRLATSAQLLGDSARRLAQLRAEGVTTIEVKSGYALDVPGELRLVGLARELGERESMRVAPTLLAAHAVPAEFSGRANDYIDLVCAEILPAVARTGNACAVDAFCERIAFTPAQVERVFATARQFGMPVKLHADQLSDSGGAALAARYGALSADHLEFTSAEGTAALARAGTVAVLLPAAFYFLRETQLPPVAALRQQGVAIALASDCNPGSSPCTSLLLVLNMGCTLFGLTVDEALLGVTRHAARALGMQADIGQIKTGMIADFALWDVGHPRELCYALGANPIRGVVESGRSRAALS